LILPFLVKHLRTHFLPFVCYSGIILAPCLRYYFNDLNAYVLLPSRIDALFIGVLITCHYVRVPGVKVNNTLVFTTMLITLFCISLLILHTDFETPGGVFNHSFLAFFSIILVILAVNSTGWIAQILSAKPLLFFSKISYMLYLSHQIFNGLFHRAVNGTDKPTIEDLNDLGISIGAFTLCVLFCWLSYTFFGSKLIKYGRTFRY